MKLKKRPEDFIVRELLDERYLCERGRFRVYRVTKTKLTSLEAAAELAERAGVPAGDVGMAGLKDRQGVTTQYMSVNSKEAVFVKAPSLRIEMAGFATEPLTSSWSLGNAFELTLRGVTSEERASLEQGIVSVREHGIPNYFGEQRFGNLRHGQGWIARDLALGRVEEALQRLMCARSDNDDPRNRRFKSSLESAWGDWRACREIAGKFRQHHSVFEHLAREPGDFAGAFRYVASKLRLIHLYAWQSHVWNRAVASYLQEIVPARERFGVPSPEGVLVFSRGAMPVDAGMKGKFRLPGPGLADVDHPLQRDLLALELRKQGLQPSEFRIEGVPGFQLKGEDRPLFVRPANLTLLDMGRGPASVIRLRFELPRGAYATLVMARLVPPVYPQHGRDDGARGIEDDDDEDEDRDDAPRGRAPTSPRGRAPASPRSRAPASSSRSRENVAPRAPAGRAHEAPPSKPVAAREGVTPELPAAARAKPAHARKKSKAKRKDVSARHHEKKINEKKKRSLGP